MTAEQPQVAWLGDTRLSDVATGGGKAAALSSLTAAYPVPPGFVLTTYAHERVRDEGHEAVTGLVTEHYSRLNDVVGAVDVAVAVRSSAVDEDSAGASFAGQHDTYLNISGRDAVVEAACACFDSAESEHALRYREEQGLDSTDIRVAVLIQRLVPADVAAVAFSANPISGSREEVVINASWGLGESIVGGTVTPDTFIVQKSDLTITGRWLGDKEVMTVPIAGGTREDMVPEDVRGQAALSDTQIGDLTRMTLDLEERHGFAVDIETAFHKEQLYLLQSRPITTLSD
jgi:pyruvate,water dikinase